MKEAPQDWASLFTAEELDEFFSLVRAWFEKEGYSAIIQGNVVIAWGPRKGEHEIAWGPHKGEHEIRYGIVNLAQICRQSDRAKWGAIIEEYFRGIRTAKAEIKELKRKVARFSEISDLLVVRLWPVEYLEELSPKRFIYREDLEGTISVLAFDLTHSFRQVKPEEAARWGKTTEELFRIALENVRRKSVLEREIVEIEKGAHILLMSDDNMLVTTHALFLEEYPECIGKGGSIVGIPNHRVLLCHPIQNLLVIKAISVLIPMIWDLYLQGPSSLVPYLYWYRGGRFTILPYRIAGEKLSFSPPAEFVELLNSLSV